MKGIYTMNNILTKQISLNEVLSLFHQEEDRDIYIRDAINLFLQHKRIYNRQGTIDYYTYNFKMVVEFLEAKGIYTVRSIDKQAIESLVLYFKGRGNKNISVNKRVNILLTLIRFCYDNNLVNHMNISYKKLAEEETKIEIVDLEDMKKIINYLPSLCTRSQVIVLILFTTGIRTSELINIESANIDFKNLLIYLKFTKTKQARYVPILQSVAYKLQELVTSNNGSKWLFPEKDNHITALAVKSLLRRLKKALNIEVLSAHKLRHLYATSLLKQGTDIKTVSRLLGHKSIRMTERYIDLTDVEIYEKNRINNPLYLTDYKG